MPRHPTHRRHPLSCHRRRSKLQQRPPGRYRRWRPHQQHSPLHRHGGAALGSARSRDALLSNSGCGPPPPESGAALGARRARAPLRPLNQLAKAGGRKGPAHKGAIRGGGEAEPHPKAAHDLHRHAARRRRRRTRSTLAAQEEGAV
jgi:hypothetical protein